MPDLEYAEWHANLTHPVPCEACSRYHRNIEHVYAEGWDGCADCWALGFARIQLGTE